MCCKKSKSLAEEMGLRSEALGDQDVFSGAFATDEVASPVLGFVPKLRFRR